MIFMTFLQITRTRRIKISIKNGMNKQSGRKEPLSRLPLFSYNLVIINIKYLQKVVK